MDLDVDMGMLKTRDWKRRD